MKYGNFNPEGSTKLGLYRIDIPAASSTYNDTEIGISGKHLYVARLRITANPGHFIGIKFNSRSNERFPIRQGDYFQTDFKRIYFQAADVQGSNDDTADVILYHWFDGDYKNLSPITPRPRFQAFANLTQYILKGELEGIHITDAGNLDVEDEYGNQQDLDNLLAGVFLPISPKEIKATTTAKGIIIYKD